MSTMPITTSFSTTDSESIYGVRMRHYAFEGKETTHADALALAAIQQSEAIESLLPAYRAIVDARQKKVNGLAEVLSTITEALGSMDTKDNSTSKKSSINSDKLRRANEILAEYGMEQMSLKDGQVTYRVAYYKQADVQAQLDTESNDLQQNMIQLQSIVNKRDNAFTVANKVIAKENATAHSTINSMGF